MSESDTMFNGRDRRCAAVQLMLSTDLSYDNRIIASTLKIQTRTVQRLRAQLNASGDPLAVVERKATSCHLTSSKSAWKSTPKCTWMCWRVWWSPGAIRWPVSEPGRGSRTRRRPTSLDLWVGLASEEMLRLCNLLSLPPPPTWTRWTTSFGYNVENITYMTSHNTKTSLIVAIHRVFAELPPALVEKACSQFRIRIEAVIAAEGGYIE